MKKETRLKNRLAKVCAYKELQKLTGRADTRKLYDNMWHLIEGFKIGEYSCNLLTFPAC